MDVSISNITDVEKEISITATPDELVPHFDSAYRRYQTKAEIKGFRKGKAPLTLVKKLFGESIEYESLDTIAGDVYRKVAAEQNLAPIGEPVLTTMDYHPGGNLTFKVKYEIKPVIDLKEYKGIPVERLIHTVTDREVDDEVLRLRKSNSSMEEAATVADTEHIVTADVQELDPSGTPLIGKRTPDARLYLADESLFPEVRDILIGATPGTTRRARVEHEHEGVKITTHVEIAIKKVEKVLLPRWDDDFIRKITKDKVSSVPDFLKQMRDDLTRYWTERTERKLTDTLISEIVRRHDVTVPESLVKGFLESLVEDVRNRYPNKKFPPDFNEKEFREHNRGYAVFQARWFLIRERIIAAEGLTVTHDDLLRLAETEAPSIGIDKERLLKFYESSDATKERILSDKLYALLKEQAKITEKVTEDPIG